MKKLSNKLLFLVKTLSSKEKNYLNKIIDNKVQKVLFNIILNSPGDEEEIKKEFEKKYPNKSYTKVKHKLFNKILLELTKYNIEKLHNPYEMELYIIKFLTLKKLESEAIKRIKKLKAELTKEENFISLIKLLRMEHNCMLTVEPYTSIQLYEQLDMYLKALIYNISCSSKYMSKLHVINRTGTISELNKIFNDYMSECKPSDMFVSNKLNHYTLLADYYFMKEDIINSLKYGKETVEIALNNDWIIRKGIRTFIYVNFFLTFSLLSKKDIKNYKHYFEKFSEYEEFISSLYTKKQYNSIKTILDTKRKILSGKLDKINIANITNLYVNNINEHFVEDLSILIVVYFMIKKDYRTAFFWLNKINHYKFPNGLPRYIKVHLKIIKIALLYEIEEYDQIIELVNNSLEKEDSPTLRNFIANFKTIISSDKKREVLKEFYNKILENENFKLNLTLFWDVPLWFKSKIDGYSYINILKYYNKNLS